MHPWLAKRTALFDSSGIRKVFDLAASMESPINLSIGQPDFDVPEAVQDAAIEAIRGGKNGYSVTQGIPELREKLGARVRLQYDHDDRAVLVTSGTSGALLLAILSLVDPGDEVIVFDPYFVMYPTLVGVAGGRCVFVDTYPDFRIDVDRVAAVTTARTKLILLNSPANPTGAVASVDEVQGLAEFAARRNIALLSDEIYREFSFQGSPVSPAQFNPDTIVIDGFSKSHGMTGWRLGFAHGPAAVIGEMTKLQQYTFVCAPQPAQWGGIAAMDVSMDAVTARFARRRDMIVSGLSDLFELQAPAGAFYAFPRAPQGTGTEFVAKAIENNLLVIPGGIFSQQDTHFRISFAADESQIERGVDVLRRLALGT